MTKYGSLERAIARQLDTFPAVRRAAKKAYQRLNYWVHRERGFQCGLHPQVELQSLDRCWESESLSYFFGYYDKIPWAPDGMKSLLMHRVVGDGVQIVRVFPNERDVLCLGGSSAWNYQQGSMAQWLQGGRVVYNDVRDGRLGAQIVDPEGGEEVFIPWPIQTVHPEKYEALSLNYKRLYRIRPSYGYEPEVSNFSANMPLTEDGLWRVGLGTGEADLIISLSQLRNFQPRPEMGGADHKVNHAMYSPEGTRFVFMHRWTSDEGKFSRLYVANADGTQLRLLMDNRMVSHYNWRDENHLLVWGRTEERGDSYYLLDVCDGTWEICGEGTLEKFGDGHPSFSPSRRWILTDTYPDKARQRHLLLFDTKEEEIVELGRFFAPWAFDGPDRCDLHPRWRPDGNYISIDSAHEGTRKSYVLDVSEIVENDE